MEEVLMLVSGGFVIPREVGSTQTIIVSAAHSDLYCSILVTVIWFGVSRHWHGRHKGLVQFLGVADIVNVSSVNLRL